MGLFLRLYILTKIELLTCIGAISENLQLKVVVSATAILPP